MPLSLQGHHALIDGMDMGVFYQKLQKKCQNPALEFLLEKKVKKK
jgi:chloramphenicol O-acetyltransferase